MQLIPYPNDAPDEIWLRSACWSQRYSCLNVWTDGSTDGRRLESHSISSPWAFGSGELKTKQQQTSKLMRICCLSHLPAAKAQVSLHIQAVLQELHSPNKIYRVSYNKFHMKWSFVYDSVYHINFLNSKFVYFNVNLHCCHGRCNDITCSRQKCYATCSHSTIYDMMLSTK